MRVARTTALLAALALAAGAPASAREHRIAKGPVETLQAGGGWVSWFKSGRQFFWHKGDRTSRKSFLGPLGTDREGRAVGLSVGCSTAGASEPGGDDGSCTVHHRVLPDGATSRLLVTQRNLRSVDEHRGTLIVGFRGRGHPRGIYLRRGGEGAPLERVSRIRPGSLSISSRAMTNLDPEGRLYAASRSRPHRWRLLARSADPDFVRGQEGPFAFVWNPQAEGRFAYWLEESFEADGSRYATRILRVDPEPSDRHLEEFTPPRNVSSLAVTRARLYYADKANGDLYEFIHPPFHRGGEPLPLGR
jgi:hypothetical protein